MARNSNVGTQYIICECGDNFPNEELLNLHLANDHGDVDTYILREPSPEPSEQEIKTNVLIEHENVQDQQKTTLKTYSRKQKTPPHTKPEKLVVKRENSEPKQEKLAPKQEKLESKPNKPQTKQVELESKPEVKKKQPPVIKLQNLKRIDSITLLQNLRNFTGFIKLEPAIEIQQPVAKLEPVSEPVPICEPEPECDTEPIELSMQDEVFVKSEMEDVNEEIYYQCDVCNTIFYTEDDFDIHYQSTHAMKVEPSAEQILEDHLVSDHIDDAGVQAEAEASDTAYYYECEMCHKIFASEEYFNLHYNKMHGGLLALTEETEEDIMIAEETEECLTEEQAAENFTIETYNGPVPVKAPEQVIYYKCDLCKILYPSEKAYNTHFDKKHGAPAAAPAGYKLIEQDLARHYPPTPRPVVIDTFCCEFCPKTFNMKRSLQVHRKRVHVDKIPGKDGTVPGKNLNRSKVCDICGRAYNSNAALRYHQRRHTGEKPYPCTMCPKRFTMPMFLQIHLRTHTGEKPYECMQCPKAFTNKAALIRHDRVHTGVKPYPCPECGKYFTQSNSMKLHVSTVHLKLPAPYKSKNRRSKSEARALQLALKGLPRGSAMEDFQRHD